jgi:hypothetical protein
MKNSSHSRVIAITFLTLTALAVHADVARLKVPLTSTGADADARASLTAVLNEAQSMVLVAGTRFTPNQEYGLYADRRLVGLRTASPSGALKFSQRNPATRSTPALRFDPRGALLQIKQGEVVLFSSVISGPGEPEGSSVQEQAGLKQLGASRKGTAAYRLVRHQLGSLRGRGADREPEPEGKLRHRAIRLQPDQRVRATPGV